MPRRRYGRPTANRRKLVWVRTSFSGAVAFGLAPALAAPTRFDLMAPFEADYGASLLGSTVVRTRGYLRVFDVDHEAGTILHVRFTAYIGNNNEVQRGPDANDSSFDALSGNKDFFLFEPFLNLTSSVAEESYDLSGRVIDVKSARKIEELNQTMILDVSARQPANTAAGSAGFAGDLSCLMMLP